MQRAARQAALALVHPRGWQALAHGAERLQPARRAVAVLLPAQERRQAGRYQGWAPCAACSVGMAGFSMAHIKVLCHSNITVWHRLSLWL
jgi:hypothetical protein